MTFTRCVLVCRGNCEKPCAIRVLILTSPPPLTRFQSRFLRAALNLGHAEVKVPDLVSTSVVETVVNVRHRVVGECC